MVKTVTQQDLLRHLYGETSPSESAEIESALSSNWKLKEEFQELLDVKMTLNEATFSPSQKSIDKILAYSKSDRHLEATC